MNPTRILLVDDHPLFRSGLAHWIRQQPALACSAEAGSLSSARQSVEASQPDLALVDLRLGDGDGLDLVREWSGSHPTLRTLVLSQCDELIYAHRVLQAGGRGYVMKSEATDVLSEAIQTVVQGEIWVSRRVHARLLHNLFPDPAVRQRDLASLSDREIQVFQLLGARLRTREISERLGISPKTVETYRDHLKEKLRLRDGKSLAEAAIRWVERGAEPSANPIH